MSQHAETDHGKLQVWCIGAGTIIAVAFATFGGTEYHRLVDNTWFVLPEWLHHHRVTPHFIVTELLMAFFFFGAGGEVRLSFMKDGPLHGWRRWLLPMIAVVGGIAGPAGLYAALTGAVDPSLSSGWVIPTATDIAFASIVASKVFGKGHPAVAFLLTLAVVDDGAGMGLIAVFYSGGVNWPVFGAIIAAAAVVAKVLRARGVVKWPIYLVVVGIPCWIAFLWLGVHTAMAFVPLALMMPAVSHAHESKTTVGRDSLGRAMLWLTPLMAPVLLLFSLTNAGINLGSFGNASWIVASSLFVGKILGIVLFVSIALLFGLALPEGMTKRDLWIMGVVASIGFTVALFVSNIAFTGETAQQAGLGAAISLVTGTVAAYGLKWALYRNRSEAQAFDEPEREQLDPAYA